MKSEVLRVVTNEGSLFAARNRSLMNTGCDSVQISADFLWLRILLHFSMAIRCTPTIISGPLLYYTVIKTKCLRILLCFLAGFVETGRGGIANLLLLPSESTGCEWNLVDLKESCIIDTHNLLTDEVAFM